jgi:hypothetical protein
MLSLCESGAHILQWTNQLEMGSAWALLQSVLRLPWYKPTRFAAETSLLPVETKQIEETMREENWAYR